jgi:hypothetical protein
MRRIHGVSIALLAVAVVVAMTAGAARAAIGITVGEPTLSPDRNSITVPVTVSCSPFDPSLTTFTTLVSVTVEQGDTNVAHASGSASAGYPSAMLFTCDGTSQTVTVTAVADLNAAPFHPGPAVASVFARAMAGIPCPDRPLCFGFIETQSATQISAVQLIAAKTQPGTSRVTQGDAQAVFNANQTGGNAILLHSGKHVGPASNDPSSEIRISGFVDGRHYCSLDWHVIAVTLFDGNLPGGTRTPHEIAAELSAFSETIDVDAVRLDTVVTPVKPAINSESLGLEDGFWFTTGRVMSPSDLAVGTHTLATEQRDAAGNITDTSNVTFVIDTAGVGACV